MAEKRFSRDGKKQVVLEREVHTSWHNCNKLEPFCRAADFTTCRACTFQELYRCYIERLEALNTKARELVLQRQALIAKLES